MDHEPTTITQEEDRLLRELAKGKSNKEISQTLMVSQRSLEYNLTELFQKLQVNSRVEIIKRAKRLRGRQIAGLFSLNDLRNYQLLPTMTVGENVAFAQAANKTPKADYDYAARVWKIEAADQLPRRICRADPDKLPLSSHF